MKTYQIKISVINPDYDPQYAKEFHFLERDYENPKFESEISFEIAGVKEIIYSEGVSYKFKTYSKHECLLKEVCVLELLGEDRTITEFVVSKSLISSTKCIDKKSSSQGYFYFYIQPNIEYVRLTASIYLTRSEIPEEIKGTRP